MPRRSVWAAEHRDPGRPLLWMHAPSVGEGLQARAILEILRGHHPEWQVAYTHFSPSAETIAARMPADVAGYLPYDLRREVDAALDALRPTAVVFTKLDLWPELATRAAARGVAVGLVAATVSPRSDRLRWPSRSLTRSGYAAVTAAGAIAGEDAARLATLGVRSDCIRVLGDPRADGVLAVVEATPADDPLLGWGAGAPTLVAGSTWPADERVLLSAFAAVRQRHPDARMILAPHEPTVTHLEALERVAERHGLPRPRRLSEASSPAPLLVVDRVGILARLYGSGSIAYVGGGFGRAGLHSVLEPAAWRVPVVVGPRWQGSRDAGLLLAAGGGVSLPSDDALGCLVAQWCRWMTDADARHDAGERAFGMVRSGEGAAARQAALVERLMAREAPGA